MSKYSRRPGPGGPASSAPDEDDLFTSRVLEITVWAQNNAQTLIFAGIVAALAVAATVYYFNFSETREDQSALELEQIHQVVGVVSTEETLAELNRFLERFENAANAAEARLLLGQVQLENGDVQAAIDALQPLRGRLGEPVALQAGFLLGAAYEQQSLWDEAVSTYLEIADETDLGFQLRNALSDAARVRAAQGRYAEAETLLGDLLAELDATDPGRGVIEMRLAEMRARTSSGG
jgi:predicted negative regulator of RcsB-dependent stress response